MGQWVGLAAQFSLPDRNFMAAIIKPLKSHPAKIRIENFSGRGSKKKTLNLHRRASAIMPFFNVNRVKTKRPSPRPSPRPSGERGAAVQNRERGSTKSIKVPVVTENWYHRMNPRRHADCHGFTPDQKVSGSTPDGCASFSRGEKLP